VYSPVGPAPTITARIEAPYSPFVCTEGMACRQIHQRHTLWSRERTSLR